ncbi:hypothetical protein [Sagittula stellata]|uniref:Uncharacterized protein n=1 Tax=Sagittula stellata (strain ATCC 700073 / DSM 11524 / E-37) TaxID=388399 RepID=A3K400_SAGS3|nr:hypothetical protein [Sagittula stellata]EBA08264.1 hypothetical protein SSE37_11989 [Sagittula stellata E-37]
MWLKLAVIGVVLVGFALAIRAVIRANRPGAHPAPRPAAPSLGEQIGLLARAGLTLSPGVTRADLTDFGPEDTYRHDPWRLLLLTFAIRIDRPPHTPFCPAACLLRRDAFDAPQDFADALRDVARAAGTADRLGQVNAADRLSYNLGGQSREISFDAATDDILRRVLDDIAALLPAGRHLAFLDNDPQVAVFCLTDAGHAMIETAAPGLLHRTPPL